MALASTGTDARPSVRTVRYTGIIDSRFTFFANRTSGKGRQLEENPCAGLCFFWPNAGQQVVVEGDVEVLSDVLRTGLPTAYGHNGYLSTLDGWRLAHLNP